MAQWLRIRLPGFPGGAVVKNPPANAGDTGSSPGLGSSHMPRSNWAREPQLLSLRVTTREEETHMPQLERSPSFATKDPACLSEDPTCHN